MVAGSIHRSIRKYSMMLHHSWHGPSGYAYVRVYSVKTLYGAKWMCVVAIETPKRRNRAARCFLIWTKHFHYILGSTCLIFWLAGVVLCYCGDIDTCEAVSLNQRMTPAASQCLNLETQTLKTDNTLSAVYIFLLSINVAFPAYGP